MCMFIHFAFLGLYSFHDFPFIFLRCPYFPSPRLRFQQVLFKSLICVSLFSPSKVFPISLIAFMCPSLSLSLFYYLSSSIHSFFIYNSLVNHSVLLAIIILSILSFIVLSFVRSFVCWIIMCLFVCSFSFIPSFVRSFIRLFVCLFVCSFFYSFVRSFGRSVGRLVVRSFVHLFVCLAQQTHQSIFVYVYYILLFVLAK